MKTIKDSLHDIIFRSIVMESKASYDKFDMTFDEFCSDKANLELKGEEVIELNKFAQDNNIVIVSKSFKSGFDYAKNYSDKYDYQNIECNVHLIRDLEKCYINTSHVWCKKFKELVQTIIHDKKSYIEKGYDSFDDTYVNNFNQKYDEILFY